jgi:hypothetical protein
MTMKTTMRRAAGPALPTALLALAGCATVPSPEIVVVGAPPGPGTLRCGAMALQGIGYETQEVSPGVVEARQAVPGRATRADRHVVELTVQEGERPGLVAVVTRWRYEAADPGRPMQRLAVQQAAPDGEELATIRTAVEACGREVRRGPRS